MKANQLDFRAQVLLSMQRALWDMVTPDLRAVAVSWGGGFVRARFLYERPPTDEVWEIVHEVETYVLADFDESLQTEFTVEFKPVDELRKLENEEWWAYRRREE